MNATQLTAALKAAFPTTATCWSQATDEIRDMSRWAREELELGDDAAMNFRAIRTPAEWNTKGIESIINFFEQMNERQKANYLTRINGML